MSKLRHSWPHMSRRDRRIQHFHDQHCEQPRNGSCACCCWDYDHPPRRHGRPRFYGITGTRSLACERQIRTTPRGRVTAGPVPLPFAHRRRRW